MSQFLGSYQERPSARMHNFAITKKDSLKVIDLLLELFMLLASIIFLTLLSAFIYHIHHKSNRRGISKKPSKQHNKHLSYQHSQHSPFHCVEAHHSNHFCQAVKAIEGKRFLPTEAPTLPVRGCDNPDCHCDYVHHEDRRCDDRRTDTGIQHDLYGQAGEQEKRNNFRHGRRKTD